MVGWKRNTRTSRVKMEVIRMPNEKCFKGAGRRRKGENGEFLALAVTKSGLIAVAGFALCVPFELDRLTTFLIRLDLKVCLLNYYS